MLPQTAGGKYLTQHSLQRIVIAQALCPQIPTRARFLLLFPAVTVAGTPGI